LKITAGIDLIAIVDEKTSTGRTVKNCINIADCSFDFCNFNYAA
jgi:hypothetical protein